MASLPIAEDLTGEREVGLVAISFPTFIPQPPELLSHFRVHDERGRLPDDRRLVAVEGRTRREDVRTHELQNGEVDELHSLHELLEPWKTCEGLHH